MSSFVSALDRPGATSDAEHTSIRWRESLRFLRHVEELDFDTVMSRNWDAQKCFVIHVTVKDNEVANVPDNQARLMVVRPTAPFQIERTPKELEHLQTAIRQWSERHDATSAACTFCTSMGRSRRTMSDATSNQSRGLFSSLFKNRETKLKGSDEWETWLNTNLKRLQQVDEATTVCEGLEHIPALFARFLLQEFATDVIM